MSPTQFRKSLVWAGVAGISLAVTLCILFGVMDVQCEISAPYWHVDSRHQVGVCLPYEVGTGPETGDHP